MPGPLKAGRGRVIGHEDLKQDILGLDVIDRGKLNLHQFKTQLPLAGLSEEIITFIQSQGGGGGDVANAKNYHGASAGQAIATASNADVVDAGGPSSWKVRGFYVYGTGDGVATLSYTPAGGSTISIKVSVDNISRQGVYNLPNPEVVEDSEDVILNIENTTSGTQTYWASIFGESV